MRADLAKARLLFWTFFKIGAFTFGGGYAMIPLIQREVAERRHWMEDSDILDIVAIAESTPGPIAINSATFVGYQVCGTFGAFCATCSTPSTASGPGCWPCCSRPCCPCTARAPREPWPTPSWRVPSC